MSSCALRACGWLSYYQSLKAASEKSQISDMEISRYLLPENMHPLLYCNVWKAHRSSIRIQVSTTSCAQPLLSISCQASNAPSTSPISKNIEISILQVWTLRTKVTHFNHSFIKPKSFLAIFILAEDLEKAVRSNYTRRVTYVSRFLQKFISLINFPSWTNSLNQFLVC